MKIEILGAGCAKCKSLEKTVREALEETNTNAEVVKVEDISDIMKYGVMGTPALVINGKVTGSGRAFRKDEIIGMLKKAKD